MTVPVQLWEAGEDHILAEPWNVEAVRRDLPQPADFHRVPHADHGDFSTPCSAVPKQAAFQPCKPPDAESLAMHTAFNAAVVVFFQKSLR